MTIETIDWGSYPFTDKAVLCFIKEGGDLLLIRKKKGLGAGKINAPGGRIEAGESPLEAAIRETQEEVGLTPGNLKKMGELNFLFTDGYSLFCHVFTATSHTGTPVETDEAIPLWTNREAIPYDEMWADDRHWLPLMLKEISFAGYFIFDNEIMLEKKILTSIEFPDQAK